MATAWKLLLVLGAILAALLLGGVLLLLAVFVGPALLSPGWENSQQVYLRNRTGAPLRVELTVPKTAVTVDTVWWGVAGNMDGIGRAAVVNQLVLQGHRHPLAAPVLLPGSADTLVIYRQYNARSGRRFFNPWSNLELWVGRMHQPQPAFNREVAVLEVGALADSVRLQLAVAPDSTLWVATVGTGFRHSDPDESWVSRDGLRPVVSWRDQAGLPHQQPFPTNHWLDTMEQVAARRGQHSYQLTHYVDYQ